MCSILFYCKSVIDWAVQPDLSGLFMTVFFIFYYDEEDKNFTGIGGLFSWVFPCAGNMCRNR